MSKEPLPFLLAVTVSMALPMLTPDTAEARGFSAKGAFKPAASAPKVARPQAVRPKGIKPGRVAPKVKPAPRPKRPGLPTSRPKPPGGKPGINPGLPKKRSMPPRAGNTPSVKKDFRKAAKPPTRKSIKDDFNKVARPQKPPAKGDPPPTTQPYHPMPTFKPGGF